VGPPGIAWDACGLLNLAATSAAGEILASQGCPSYVARQVREGEVLYQRPLPEEDPEGRLVPVDLSPLFEANLMVEIEPTEGERESAVIFAQEIDDGEALTAAIARHRRLRVATDDRAAIRLLTSLAPPIPVLRTPDWLRTWAAGAGVERAALAAAARRITLCARFVPRRGTPDHDWWQDRLEELP